MSSMNPSWVCTRRQYLMIRIVSCTGVDYFRALEAVSSTAIEHPEWDMAEKKTYQEWEEEYK